MFEVEEPFMSSGSHRHSPGPDPTDELEGVRCHIVTAANVNDPMTLSAVFQLSSWRRHDPHCVFPLRVRICSPARASPQ